MMCNTISGSASITRLESRLLLSGGSTTLHNGLLTVLGTSGADTIVVRSAGGSIVVSVNGHSKSFPASSLKKIVASAEGGNDRMSNLTSLPSTLRGGSGNDSVIAGTGNDSIDGGSGNDTLDYSLRRAS